ncbi:unnamed protein product [Protopolystoma xenopodis]|uniref:Cadherin domain-containing protein n=1 Tax=Protopolystoma xenopodis TaxID=117903 RepID=A0A3S5BF85_9PLAT|nr:unnamed protein product [Protopolystoma xenopodis]
MLSSYSVSVAEDAPVGKRLLQVRASDADANGHDLITYSLVWPDITGSGLLDSRLETLALGLARPGVGISDSISSASWQMSLLRQFSIDSDGWIRLVGSLDREIQETYVLKVSNFYFSHFLWN